jgi:predicted nucleic acid-binding protein
MPGDFIDTNVLLYLAFDKQDKSDRVECLIADGGTISVQVLNEIANVARRKMRLSWPKTNGLLGLLRALLQVVPVTIETHEAGLALAERYGFSTYDAMIVASAILCGCETLWSEDMQHGMAIEDRLRIVNPFVTGQ